MEFFRMHVPVSERMPVYVLNQKVYYWDGQTIAEGYLIDIGAGQVLTHTQPATTAQERNNLIASEHQSQRSRNRCVKNHINAFYALNPTEEMCLGSIVRLCELIIENNATNILAQQFLTDRILSKELCRFIEENEIRLMRDAFNEFLSLKSIPMWSRVNPDIPKFSNTNGVAYGTTLIRYAQQAENSRDTILLILESMGRIVAIQQLLQKHQRTAICAKE